MSNKSFHIQELDGLRGIAVLTVLIGHVHIDFWFKAWFQSITHLNGDLGVDIFFVLSGFLITRVLISDQKNNVARSSFFLRRSARLMPAYLLFIAGVGLVWGIGPELPWSLTYTYNYGRFFNMFLIERPLGHTWSLCVEEHFYLIWPFVFWFFGRRANLFCVVAIILSVVSVFIIDLSSGSGILHYVQVFQPTHNRFVSISIGCLFGLYEDNLSGSRKGLLIVAILSQVFIVLFNSGPVSAVLGMWLGEVGLAKALISQNLKAVSIFSIVFWCSVNGFKPVNCILKNSTLCWVGKISYGLYLYHFPIYWLLDISGPTKSDSLYMPWIAFLGVFLVAELSYRYFEAPILKWTRSRSAKRVENAHKGLAVSELN